MEAILTKKDIGEMDFDPDYIEIQAKSIVKEMGKPYPSFGYIIEKCDNIESFIKDVTEAAKSKFKEVG